MRLADLVAALNGAGTLPGTAGEREVTAVVQDSRHAASGSLFVAVRGFHSDGHRFISKAFEQGAVAAVADEQAAVDAPPGAAVIRVADTRVAMARLAARFYGDPSRRLALVGITGTNGKTTTSYLARAVLEASGGSCGLIGTIDYRIGDRVYPAPNTTPEAPDLQRLLAEMAANRDQACVMEVSSHALVLKRVDECVFRAAAFTNLTQDHLDFHGNMESYFRAKLMLFQGLAPDAAAVVNADDVRADDVRRSTRARIVTFGFSERADVRPAGELRHGIDGLAFIAATPSGPVEIRSPLVGRHNAYNILAAVGIGTALGVPPDAIGAGIASIRAVPGRMEKVDAGRAFSVIVDYAHTEDALTRLLDAVREIAEKRVITVFGCGGDRDRTKRPRMGAAALAGSDLVIVTSDNPRTEDPFAIIMDIEAGMRGGRKVAEPGSAGGQGGTPYSVIPDRAAAIRAAIGTAGTGDVVVLAGKGHEDYQVLGRRKVHFDDREQAREAARRC